MLLLLLLLMRRHSGLLLLLLQLHLNLQLLVLLVLVILTDMQRQLRPFLRQRLIIRFSPARVAQSQLGRVVVLRGRVLSARGTGRSH